MASYVNFLLLFAAVSSAVAFIPESPLVHKPGYTWRPGLCAGNTLKTITAKTTDECLKGCTASCVAVSWNPKDKKCITFKKTCTVPGSATDGNQNMYDKFAYKTQVKHKTGNTPFNLAYRKPCAQMMTLTDKWCQLANDGNRDSKDHTSCAVVDKSTTVGYNWWYVDLGASTDVRLVSVVHKQSTTEKGARNFKIYVTDLFDAHNVFKYYNNFTMCGEQGSDMIPAGALKEFHCPRPLKGRYVVILKFPAIERLELCEVEVYGPNSFDNLAVNKPANHFPPSATSMAVKSVDGNLNPAAANGGCSTTGTNGLPIWWRVDLGAPYSVREIYLFNIADSKGKETVDFAIRVDKTYCYYQTPALADSDVKRYICYRRTVGRMVYFEKRTVTKALNFCELEVYGHRPDKNVAYLKPLVKFGNQVADHKANDGDVHPTTSCFTSPGAGSTVQSEFLIIDLLAMYKMKYFVLANDNAATSTLEKVSIYAFKELLDATRKGTTDHKKGGELCTTFAKIPAKAIQVAYCDGLRQVVGRYVYIWKESKSGVKTTMKLCEVEVYGERFDGDLAHNMPTNISTVYYERESSLAVDGNEYSHNTMCATTLKSKGKQDWWSVDLGKKHDIYKVTVVNPSDCKETCLRQYKILVANDSDIADVISNSNYVTCYEESARLKDGELKTLYCRKGSVGQHVIITTTGKYSLTLCEVKVYESGRLDNVALKQPASQKGDSDASPAVDGLKYTKFGYGSCSMSCGSSYNEWWAVKLAKRHRVYVIKVVPAEDKHGYLGTFEVNVAEAFNPRFIHKTLFTHCAKRHENLDYGTTKYARCYAMATGRHVVILKRKPNFIPIVLCEVEVYGLPIDDDAVNIAPKHTAKQSSNLNTLTTPNKATDGLTSPSYYRGSCAITGGTAAHEWWILDMGADNYDIDSIGIITKAYNSDKQHHMYKMNKNAGKKHPDGAFATRTFKKTKPTWVSSMNQDDEYDCVQWCHDLYFCYAVVWDKKTNKCTLHADSTKTGSASNDHNLYVKTPTLLATIDKAAYFKDIEVGVLREFSTVADYKANGRFPCYERNVFTSPGDIKGVNCPEGTFGKVVFIGKKGANTADGPLALCEVEVFGKKSNFNASIAAKKTATQVTTKGSNTPGKAVDGSLKNSLSGGSCSQTAGTEDNEWWSVDLTKQYNVTHVHLVATDTTAAKMNNFSIIASDTFSDADISALYPRKTGTTPAPPTGFKYKICEKMVLLSLKNGQSHVVECEENTLGRHLTIVKHKSKGNPLELCEVEAFGKEVAP